MIELPLMAYDENLAERIRELIGSEPGLSERKMFGGLTFLINGHMTIAASGQGGLLVRTDPVKTNELESMPEAEVMVMRGRPMPGWLRISSENVSEDDDLKKWVEISSKYTSSLPPKS